MTLLGLLVPIRCDDEEVSIDLRLDLVLVYVHPNQTSFIQLSGGETHGEGILDRQEVKHIR